MTNEESKILHRELFIEEIQNHFGFDCIINGGIIKVNSFIGVYEYKCAMYNHGYMSEFFRFCYCYGEKLIKYGIENKNKSVKP